MPSDLKTDLVESTLAGAAWDEYINAMGKILSYLYHACPKRMCARWRAKRLQREMVVGAFVFTF